MRAAKVCTEPTCPNTQPCPDHQRRAWTQSHRRARLRKGSGHRQQKLRRFVLARDRYTCHRCGKTFAPSDLVNDHVVPLGEGGADNVENMAACCKRCHRDKTAEEAARARAA